jgi:hypothetical protein
MAAGVFTDSVLPKVLVKADRMWMDNQANAQYVGRVDAALNLMREQTAKVDGQLQGKDNTVTVAWLNACAITAEDCGSACTFAGNELESAKKDYTIATCKKSEFKVAEKKMRSNLFEYTDVVAQGLLASSKALDELIAKAAVSFLEANLGVNVYNNAAAWTITGTNTTIPSAQWTAGLIGKFIIAGVKNKLVDPFLFSGENLSYEAWDAMMKVANAEGKGDQNKFTQMRKYFDLFNVEVINSPKYKTYLVDRGAAALATKTYFDPAPRTLPGIGHVLFSIESRNLPGVRYDVTYTVTCSADEYFHNYKLEAHYDWLINPTGCTATATGILGFEKV